MPNMEDLTAQMGVPKKEPEDQDRVSSHIEILAERLREAFDVVRRQNKIGRARQKIQYDKNTKLVTFSEGDYIYLKETTVGVGKSKKFSTRWRGPYLITKRFSDLNYQIQIKPGKYSTVNVNRMKKYHKLPGKVKDVKKKTLVTPEREFSDDDWSDSDDKPLHLLGRPRQIPSFPDETQNLGENNIERAPVNDGPTQIYVETDMTPLQEAQNDEEPPVEMIETSMYPLQNPNGQISETAGVSQLQEPMEGEDVGNNQNQPYPYSLRPLPGQWNYNSAESAND
jgi:hypothetical protein